jgi:hypothetical protein
MPWLGQFYRNLRPEKFVWNLQQYASAVPCPWIGAYRSSMGKVPEYLKAVFNNTVTFAAVDIHHKPDAA